jgi:Domain of unknown function (DUF6484)
MSKPLSKRASVVRLEAQQQPSTTGHKIGWLVGVEDGRVVVDYPGNRHGPLAARTLVGLDTTGLSNTNAQCHEVLLAFDCDQDDRPIVLGLLATTALTEPVTPSVADNDSARPTEALLDGKRVVLEAHDEIVLRCGQASITLRRNGRVVIRGTYVETHSKGVNRIKGGSVQIN